MTGVLIVHLVFAGLAVGSFCVAGFLLRDPLSLLGAGAACTVISLIAGAFFVAHAPADHLPGRRPGATQAHHDCPR